ncbi:hypothetical protein E2C01_007550 [Portunus trituberculatus]|uniref:Uncharacterized protein n=1 Tax=Portunus trituberculatus TaxID=210409 RepID=A0A5B7D0F0_PORTR|nr:hypothetical protein [Portunus trituberculatus]
MTEEANGAIRQSFHPKAHKAAFPPGGASRPDSRAFSSVDLPLCVCACAWAASLASLQRVRSPTHTLSKAWPVLQAPLTGGPRTNERQPSTN